MKTNKKQITEFKIFGKKIAIGPGTVPTSPTSVPHTIISEVIARSKKASRDGIYEEKEKYDYQNFRTNS